MYWWENTEPTVKIKHNLQNTPESLGKQCQIDKPSVATAELAPPLALLLRSKYCQLVPVLVYIWLAQHYSIVLSRQKPLPRPRATDPAARVAVLQHRRMWGRQSNPGGAMEIGSGRKRWQERAMQGGNKRAFSQGLQYRSSPSTNQLSTKAFLARH